MVLSRNCDGCTEMKACLVRFKDVDGLVDRRVYCPDGTSHIVDYGTTGGPKY